MELKIQTERKSYGRATRLGLYSVDAIGRHKRIGCAWETPSKAGLFNWLLFSDVTDCPRATGFGLARDGYSMEQACSDLRHEALKRAA